MIDRRAFLPLLLFLLASFSIGALAEERVECNAIKTHLLQAGSVGYCALLPPSYGQDKSKVFPVLYLLHGLGDNQESLINTGGWNLIEKSQSEKKIGEFVIITPNGGRSFYINSKDGRTRYEDFLLEEFIPRMERKYRVGGSRARRAISGFSMGGYGALRVAFKHPEMFASVTGHSAALIEKLPRGLDQASSASAFIGPAFGKPPDLAYWDANSPFTFARRARLNGLKIYFDCGDHDEYGFDAGAKALDRLLTKRKVPHEFHIYPGGHGLEYFLEHLPASLEFESKALGFGR